MAPGPSGISVYAELLPNIRQVSVGASLPGSPDATTSAEVVDGGLRFRISHQGQSELLDLPATVTAPSVLVIPRTQGSNPSWRLPASIDEASALRSATESQVAPWSSMDLKVGSSVTCRNCGNLIVPGEGIRVWKDLPSENWAEMMEFWHCHKPHDHKSHEDEGLADRGYGANHVITAQPGVGFVDITSFMFSESDCSNVQFLSSIRGATFNSSSQVIDYDPSNKHVSVVCGGCQTEIGLYKVSSSSILLFKWQVTCETVKPSNIPSQLECLASTLLATISRSGYAKSVLIPYRPESHPQPLRVPHLWVLNPNVVYTSSTCRGKRAAVKILYRDINVEEANGFLDSITSDVQEINLPLTAIKATREALASSTVLIPERERSFQGWSAGLLDRWSIGP
ncbi:hypothetical protein HIM_07137 [Hirsutella minnesotensis 3608]|uniref:Ubiquitin-conjugating enzyme E2C-binding protein n=1 Tax=Hirsutella minnesotensis 3608 TaxID=1043627 RepID=A0A0F7ZIB5_9HYPO|nr:hypothetical protein HIM_07137 [Hirsutella minnesotensis 3608]